MIINLISAENDTFLTRILLLSSVKMVNYEVIVSAGNLAYAGTFNSICIKLVGTDGESEHTWLIGFRGPLAFHAGAVSLKYPFPYPLSLMRL